MRIKCCFFSGYNAGFFNSYGDFVPVKYTYGCPASLKNNSSVNIFEALSYNCSLNNNNGICVGDNYVVTYYVDYVKDEVQIYKYGEYHLFYEPTLLKQIPLSEINLAICK